MRVSAGAVLAMAAAIGGCGAAPAPAPAPRPPAPAPVAEAPAPVHTDRCEQPPGEALRFLLEACRPDDPAAVGAAVREARGALHRAPYDDEAATRAAWLATERATGRRLCVAGGEAEQVDAVRRIVLARQGQGDEAGAAVLALDALDRWGAGPRRDDVVLMADSIDWVPNRDVDPWPDGLDACASRVGEVAGRALASRCEPGLPPVVRVPRERGLECRTLRRLSCELADRAATVLSRAGRHAEASRAYEELAFGGGQCARENGPFYGEQAAYEARDAGDEERARELFRRVAETWRQRGPQTVCGSHCNGRHRPW